MQDSIGIPRPRVKHPILRLLISPLSLADAAMSLSSAKWLAIGACALLVEFMLPLAVVFGGMNEPYRSLSAFLTNTLTSLPISGLIATIPVSICFLSWCMVASFRRMSFQSFHAELMAFWLAPIAVLVPWILWGILFIINHTRSVLLRPPSWTISPIISFLGSGWWFFGLLLVTLANLLLAVHRLKRLVPSDGPPRCRQCDYLLIGLNEPRCPECGTAFDLSLLTDVEYPQDFSAIPELRHLK